MYKARYLCICEVGLVRKSNVTALRISGCHEFFILKLQLRLLRQERAVATFRTCVVRAATREKLTVRMVGRRFCLANEINISRSKIPLLGISNANPFEFSSSVCVL